MAGKRKSRGDASSPVTEAVNAKESESINDKLVLLEESDDDEGSVIGICPCKEYCEANRPFGLNALDYPHIVSQIIDEAVMRMKDRKDQADFTYICRSQLPSGTLQEVIRQVEDKYALPYGTIKESTVKSRTKAFKKKDKSMSLLQKIEQPLLRWCIREAKAHPEERAEDILDFLPIINMAKVLLQEKAGRLDGDDLINYNPAKDWMKLGWDWVMDFKRRAFDVFDEHGVHLDPRNYVTTK